MAGRLGVVSICALMLLTAPAAGGSLPPPELPRGSCEGSWEPPRTVVPLYDAVPRPGDDRGPYPGFHANAIASAASRMPGYAGAWDDDRERRFTVTFVFTGNVRARLAKLRRIAPFPGNLKGKRACFSIPELRAIMSTVADELMRPDDPPLPVGRRISGVGIDVVSNRVAADLRRHTRRAERTLERRYAPALCVPRTDIPGVVFQDRKRPDAVQGPKRCSGIPT